ncbi:hypothetical protein [Psychrobacter immobilis]|uniref:hypothetical protein n=1 Tax=Psychrobacter immobilis TaxID=498 RepID=UPI003FD3B915
MAFDTTVEEVSEAPEPTEAVEHDEAQAETIETDEVEQDEQTQGNDDADDESNDESDAEPEPEKKGGRASERIKQLVAEKKAFEAELEQLRQQSQQPKQTANSDGAPVKPNIEDYDLENGLDDYFAAQAEYEEKHQDWKLDQRLQQREQAKQQEQRNAEIVDTFNARFKANPEFKENFQQLSELMQDKPIQADPSELYQGDDLMDILEHVAADHDLYYEIADMPQAKQYAEFGRINAQIQAKKGGTSKAARQSKAPPPPNHTQANAPIKKNAYSMSDDDFMRSRGL